jgi:fatty acid-binding protein DegV
MPISPAKAHKNKIDALAIKNDKGVIVDYKNPFPAGSDKAKFVDALSVNGKKMLYENQYAFETFGYAVSAEGLEKALEKVDVIVSLHPPQNTDPYADAKKYYNQGNGSFSDFLKLAVPMLLPAIAPALGASIGSALGATGSTAAALGNAVIGGTLAEATGGDFLKGAATSGITSLLQTDLTPAVAESVGGGTVGNVVSGALTGGVTSALKGGDLLSGAISGGIGGLTEPLSETDASFMAADAAQLAKQGLSESQISETLSSGYASTTAADLAASLAVGNNTAAKIEKELDKLSETVGLTPVETTDPELVAADALGIAEAASRDNEFATLDNELLDTTADAEFLAADAEQLAEQGLETDQISETLSSGYASTEAADLAAELAVSNTSVDAITESLIELSKQTDLSFDPVIQDDAEFLAADAEQLAKQGLETEQISDTLSSGYASTTAADTAAELATSGASIEDITDSLVELSKTTGLEPVNITEEAFQAADDQAISDAVANSSNLDNELLKGGVDIGAIEQNLTASGVDPLVAADVANEVALNPNISVDDLSNYIEDFYGKTVYDVPNLEFDPTEPPDTRPEGEILVDTTKEAITPEPVITTPSVSTGAPTGIRASGLFSQPTMPVTAPEDPYNFGANIAFGNTYQNPFARERSERQSLIAGLFNL